MKRNGVAQAMFVSLLGGQGASLALGVVFLFAALRYEAFLTPENLLNVLRQNSMLGLVALGMTFVILTGGIDLSVGSMVAVAGVIAANLSMYGLLLATVAAVGCTALLGFANGLVIARARIPPFIVTLAMMIGARGIALACTGEQSVRVNRLSTQFTFLGRGHVGPVPVPILLLAAAFFLAWLSLAHTAFGRHVYALGDNQEAARLMGLNSGRVIMAVYTLSGALSGLAGVILASRLGTGQPVAGTAWELDAIAAVVVGGTLLTGGQGGAGSTLIGVLLLGVLFNVFNLEGTISSWWQWVLRGLFLLAVVIVQSTLNRRESIHRATHR
ncbi:MAG: ABC transporter permease [Acidobacteriaceae bacterium]|nr:ABC transporter permease [Acidobacteriaceae bacterium]